MKHAPVLAFALALTAGSALAAADPLTEALDAGNGALCFTRSYDSDWLKSHPGQTVRKVTLSLARDGSWPGGGPTLRLRSEYSRDLQMLVFGGCEYTAEGINRGVADNVLDPSFKAETGLTCFATMDVTGASAEEGGDFFVDWADGQTIQLHLPDSVGAWKTYNTGHNARFTDVRAQDRIIRLERAPASACAELRSKFAPRG